MDSAKALQPTDPVESGPAESPSERWFGALRRLWAEDLNFLLTNRLPRRQATLFMGWFSKLEIGWLRDLSLWVWRRFAPDLDLSEARKPSFSSLHDCFVRQLADGARPIAVDPSLVTSPCDALVGAFGRLAGTEVLQAKGFPYRLEDLLPDPALVAKHRDGVFVTLRIKSSFYHRFHAPCEGALCGVTYISGDTWNVNPIALRRVEKLFCKNERAVLDLDLPGGQALTLVPVAAILVAGIKLHCLSDVLDLRYRGPNRLPCSATFHKGDELGYFQHGSTILVFASGGFEFVEGLREGQRIRVGEPLLRGLRAAPAASSSSSDR